MKISMYFNYTSRSLLRGGQRTVLAIFCVAIGVMAIVSLQLAGSMLHNSLTSNIRATNGGDIAVTTQSAPFTSSDLTFFTNLKNAGTITNYSAFTTSKGLLSATGSSYQSFTVQAVDPGNYPIVTPATFTTPDNGNLADLLTNNQVVVTQSFLDNYNKKLNDSFNVYIKAQTGTGQTVPVKIVGIVAATGAFAQASNLVLISTHDYQASVPSGIPATYNTVDMTTADQAHTDAAVKAIHQQFPLAPTTTVADALTAVESSLDIINKFLQIAGLLALLIGGVGIINTMQVLLSRRKTEIAMLKTAGYRRIDLYLLFGLEAGLLGLIGGIVGSVASIGVSYIVRNLMQNLGMSIPFALDPWTIAGGVAIGCVTALIFGLMPIVQAANIRPLNVIRNLSVNKSIKSLGLTVVLVIILSVLFCMFAIVILNNNVILGIEAVYGTFAFLLLLSAFFSVVILLVSKLPVPEGFQFKQLALILLGIAVSALVYLILPVFGFILLAISLFGILVVFLPGTWKVSLKMALRNIGRQRTRTTTTALALFIGLFTIGLMLTLGQDLQDELRTAFVQNLKYNIVATTYGADTTKLQSQLATIPGLSTSRQDTVTQVMPTAINGRSLQQVLPNDQNLEYTLNLLSSLEGYDLAHTTPASPLVQGRNLTASDAGTNNVLISYQLTSAGILQMKLKIGDTITFASPDGKVSKTVTIVGVYNGNSNIDHMGNVLTANELVKTLSVADRPGTTTTYMKIDLAQVTNALNRLGNLVPNATVLNQADIGTYYGQQLNNLLSILVALASLSVIASIIIIANAVALAMLERRRELGIFKAVGYTSSTVLNEVLMENGIVGTVAALIAMFLSTWAVTLAGSLLFNLSLGVPVLIVISLVIGSAILAMLTAGLVAWGSVRVRPLEVLRYE